MQIATNITKRTTIVVPDTTTLVEGQIWSNLGTPYNSVGVGTDNFGVGVAMVDVPARAVYNPAVSPSIPMNSPRATPFASEGLVAIRVLDAGNFAALTAGGRFGVFNGQAVTVGTAGTIAATFGSAFNILTIKSKVTAPSGAFFILVEIQ